MDGFGSVDDDDDDDDGDDDDVDGGSVGSVVVASSEASDPARLLELVLVLMLASGELDDGSMFFHRL